MEEDIQLTPEQKQKMIDFWNSFPTDKKPNLKDIICYVWEKELDGRTKEGRAVKNGLGECGFNARSSSLYYPNKVVELTDKQKDYITNNAGTNSSLEMARTLFNNIKLTNLDVETRAVAAHIKTLDPTVVINNGNDASMIPEGDYEPPKTLDKILRKVNAYCNSAWEKEKLTAYERKCLDRLIKYLHTFRFVKQMNTYDNESDRKSFEDAFVRYTFNKPELSEEEIDQYIVLANEVVLAFKAQRRSEKLQGMLEDITNNDPENARIAMSMVEAIGKAQAEYNLSIKRQQDLLEDLTEKRSDKLSKEIKDTASVLNLLHEWKNEQTRKQWLKLAEIEQRSLDNEVERLASLEDLKCRILGLSKDEMKY